MVGQPGHIGIPRRRVGQRRKGGGVERRGPVRCECLRHGEPGKLMAEGHPAGLGREHSGAQAFVQAVGHGPRQRLQQPRLDPLGADGHRLEQLGRRRAQTSDAGEHRVTHSGRDPPAAGGEHLGDEERIAVGDAVELIRRRRRAAARGSPLRLAEAAPPRVARSRPGSELPEEDPERVAAVELVVAVAGQDQRGSGLDPASKQSQNVARRLVGPMDVLEHQDRRPLLELRHQRSRELMRRRAALDQLSELPARDLGHVQQRSQGAGCEQRLTTTPQHPRRVPLRVAKPPQQNCLAHSRLASDQDEPPSAVRSRPEALFQRR
jgi:hypothetical protein